MLIALVSHYWRHSRGGGVLSYITNLVAELQKNAIVVKVVFKEGIDEGNYQIKGHRFLFPIKAFLVLKRIRPEAVLSQGPWYCLLSGCLYKKFYGTKLIHTFHSSLGNRRPPLYERTIIQFLSKYCDRVIFVSKSLESEYEEIAGLKLNNSKVIYAGATPTKVSESDIKEFREKFGLKDNSIVLLAQAFTANRLKAEGAKLLIKTVVELKDKYPNIVLLLTREGPFSNELKEFSKKCGLYDKVIFTGDVDNPYVPLAICDIYTHITLSDGLPLALLEAMSMGKPIIATAIGGVPEAISNMETGIIVKPDTRDIAKAIGELLLNKELAIKLGANARKDCDARFTWEKSAKEYIKLIY
jgi:glycosyltransferase involved in cell wall biosynthesis